MTKISFSNGLLSKQAIHARKDEVKQRLVRTSVLEKEALIAEFGAPDGLDEEQIEESLERYGSNKITHDHRKSFVRRMTEAFVNPFTAILFVLASVSFVTDYILASPGEKSLVTVIIITVMVMISGILRFVQETRSGNAAAKLSEMVENTTRVQRKNQGEIEIPMDEVVVGDIVHLAAGDMVPADVRVVESKDLFISQGALTGESEPQEKFSHAVSLNEAHSLTEYPNLAFMGSNVVIGAAKCMVIATGEDTLFGSIAKTVAGAKTETNFEKGVRSVSWVLIRFMLVMVPVVLLINGFTKGDWLEAFLFAISVAVGLTPEMLPMIVTTCLAKGAVAMSRQKTIIKNLNSIQNFGAVDILCTDKTGTLTQDKIILEYHWNVQGEEDVRVLRHAFLNSFYQTGLKNLLDFAIIDHTEREGGGIYELSSHYEKIDEIPFDFNRRRMSVVVTDKTTDRTQMITKGAVEEMLHICSQVEYGGRLEPITEELKTKIFKTVDDLNDDGMRVIAVAERVNLSSAKSYTAEDESDMILLGYIAFLDPPKETVKVSLQALHDYGVEVKILTGDNDRVTRCICRQVGIRVNNLLLGSDIEKMDDSTLKTVAEKTEVFAKLSPDQKARIVDLLRKNGHVVGFMGDGINDTSAMKASDVGISVDTAVDIAKESADVILLEKNLMVLCSGIIEGRKTYANMIKYIKMTASSNFGNVFSIVCASAFLPFLPMAAMHLVLLNLIYDLSCTAIPWDNVDEDFLRKPRKWDASSIASFMKWIGPTSSVFDITTYLVMYFIICPMMCGGLLYTQIEDPELRLCYIAIFQSGWFIESMWSQALVIHMIRTPKIPFVQSRASWPVICLSFSGIAVLTTIPYTILGEKLKLAPLNATYFVFLGITIVLYMSLVTVFKKIFIKRHGELL